MQDIETLFQAYREAWLENSAARIESFWDTTAGPLYKAEEILHIITDWDELRAYWRHNERFNSVNELSYSDFVYQSVTNDVLLAGARMRWDIRFAEDVKQMDGTAFAWAGEAMGGDNHILACLRKAGGKWKLTAWIEAPDAPLLYMAELYKKNIRPDFRGA